MCGCASDASVSVPVYTTPARCIRETCETTSFKCNFIYMHGTKEADKMWREQKKKNAAQTELFKTIKCKLVRCSVAHKTLNNNNNNYTINKS